jgi:hypothetical protein
MKEIVFSIAGPIEDLIKIQKLLHKHKIPFSEMEDRALGAMYPYLLISISTDPRYWFSDVLIKTTFNLPEDEQKLKDHLQKHFPKKDEVDHNEVCEYCENNIDKDLNPQNPVCEGGWCTEAEEGYLEEKENAAIDTESPEVLLLKVAKKRYPIGTKVRSAYSTEGIIKGDCKISLGDVWVLLENDDNSDKCSRYIMIYNSSTKEWADIIPEKLSSGIKYDISDIEIERDIKKFDDFFVVKGDETSIKHAWDVLIKIGCRANNFPNKEHPKIYVSDTKWINRERSENTHFTLPEDMQEFYRHIGVRVKMPESAKGIKAIMEEEGVMDKPSDMKETSHKDKVFSIIGDNGLLDKAVDLLRGIGYVHSNNKPSQYSIDVAVCKPYVDHDDTFTWLPDSAKGEIFTLPEDADKLFTFLGLEDDSRIKEFRSKKDQKLPKDFNSISINQEHPQASYTKLNKPYKSDLDRMVDLLADKGIRAYNYLPIQGNPDKKLLININDIYAGTQLDDMSRLFPECPVTIVTSIDEEKIVGHEATINDIENHLFGGNLDWYLISKSIEETTKNKDSDDTIVVYLSLHQHYINKLYNKLGIDAFSRSRRIVVDKKQADAYFKKCNISLKSSLLWQTINGKEAYSLSTEEVNNYFFGGGNEEEIKKINKIETCVDKEIKDDKLDLSIKKIKKYDV